MWRFLRPGASIRCTWGLFKAGYSCRAFFWLDMIALKLGSWLWMSRGNWPVSTSRIIWNHDSPVEHCGLMPKKLVILGIPLQHTGSLWSYHWSYCLSYTSQRSQHFQPVSFGGFSKHIKDVSAARNLVRSAAFQQRYLGSRKIHTPHEGWDVQIPGGVLQLFQVLCHFCNTNFFGWAKLAKIPVLDFRSRMGNEGIFTSMPGDPFGGAIVQGTGVVDFSSLSLKCGQRVVQVVLFQFLLSKPWNIATFQHRPQGWTVSFEW